MVLAVNYANEKYREAQKFNTISALRFGADQVLEYSPDDISKEYRQKNEKIFQYERGNGYWIWKPYIIMDALKKLGGGLLNLY